MTEVSAGTLTDFLLARNAEDEIAVAEYVQGGAVPLTLGVAYHRALGMDDPARRVLAECEAKRRIVELHQDYGCTAAGQPGHETCGEREWCYACGEHCPSPCDTLRLLALPYADHEHFRPEWRI